jgi:hypothetical protein
MCVNHYIWTGLLRKAKQPKFNNEKTESHFTSITIC